MKRLFALFGILVATAFGQTLKDVKIPQLSKVSPPTWPDVVVTPVANSLLGFGADKTVGNVTVGSGLVLLNGVLTASGAPGSGTVTDFTAGALSPLFTTSVATSTSTPALTFTLSTHTANTIFAGPTTGSAAAPTFRPLVAADIPSLPYGTGDVVGPSSATDNALARFDTTTGKLIQNSLGLLSDTGALTGITGFNGLVIPTSTSTLDWTAQTFASEQEAQNFLLRDWNAAIAKIQNSVTKQAVVAILGDSWSSANYYTPQLTSYLQSRYGNAGAGYVSINTTSAPSSIAGTSKTRLGTWTDAGAGTATAVNLGWSSTTDVATPGSWSVTATSTDFILHYTKQASGGSFRWKIDAGSYTTVSTANASQLFATVSITGLSNASHTLYLEATVAGSGVIINGVDCQNNTGSGIRVHNLGFSGTTTANWAGVSAANWEAGIAALAPNLVMILLGVNDQTGNVVPATSAANLGTVRSNVTAAISTSDFVILTPSDISASTTYTMAQYVSAFRDEAAALPAGFVDGYKLFGTWAAANARGLMTNASHINTTGGYILSDYIGEYLTRQQPGSFGIFPGSISVAGTATVGTLAVTGSASVSGVITANGSTINGSGAADLVVTAGGTSHTRVAGSTAPDFEVFDSTATATGVGGSIWLSGLADVGNRAKFAGIVGRKTNGTAANYLGKLALQTSNGSNVLTDALVLNETQDAALGGTTAATAVNTGALAGIGYGFSGTSSGPAFVGGNFTAGGNLLLSSTTAHIYLGSLTPPSSGALTHSFYNSGTNSGMQWINGSGGGLAFVSLQGGGGNFYTVTGAVGSETYTQYGAASGVNYTFSGALAITGALSGVTTAGISGLQTLGGTRVTTAAAMGALAIDVTKAYNTKTVAVDSTFTFSGTPGASSQWFGMLVTNSDTADHTLTIPSSFSVGRQSAITTTTLPASGKLFLQWTYDGSAYNLYGDPPATSGTGSFALTNGATFVAPILGTVAAGSILTNATLLPLTTGVTGILPVANGGTGTATPALVQGTNVTITGTWPNQTINASGGGGGSPGGSTTQVQYNSSGSFAGAAGFTFDGTAKVSLGVNTTTLGQLKLFGNTSGDATIQPAAVAGSSTVVTLPNASSTLPIFGQQITFAGPTAARTVTFPDAAFTAARTDAANTFTGASTASAWVLTSPTITTKISPTTDDGAPLGDTTHNFSDLFLASGAVINFANSDVVFTHSTGILTEGTGDLRITTAGTNAASVVTVGGTQTLTNKTLTTAALGSSTATTQTAGDASTKVSTTAYADRDSQLQYNAQTGTTYTLVLTDGTPGSTTAGVSLSNAAAVILTVPTNASVAFPTGWTIPLLSLGAGAVTIAPAGGVTINSPGGLLTIGTQNGTAVLNKTGTNTWQVYGLGSLPAVVSGPRLTGQTAAASLTAYTVGAADSSFLVSANVLVTTSTVHSFTTTCTYSDEGNTSRTLTLTFSNVGGTLVTAIANAAGAVPYEGVPLHIRAKAATTITFATVGTFTTVTYNVEGVVTQIK